MAVYNVYYTLITKLALNHLNSDKLNLNKIIKKKNGATNENTSLSYLLYYIR